MIELSMWLSLTAFMAASAVQLLTGDLAVLTSIGYVILFGYARSVRYLDLPSSVGNVWHRLGAFALAPIYGAVHITLLIPLRWIALITIRDGKWGTRESVEVGLYPQPAMAMEDTGA